MTLFKTNIRELKSYARSGPVSNRPRIQKIIELYSSRKIPNFKTALNAVLLLASNHKLTISSNKAVKAYDQLMTKYESAVPVTGILSRRTVNRKRPLVNVEVVFYGSIDEETEIATRIKNRTFTGLSQLKHSSFSFDSEHMIFEKWKGNYLHPTTTP